MKEELLKLLQGVVGEGAIVELSVPEEPSFGHFSTNVAMRLAKQAGKRPIELAEEIVIAVQKAAPDGFLEKIEAASPGFVNFWLSKKTIQEEFAHVVENKKFGMSETMAGKTVMVEFTDPNPFKFFHIGHLMSNTIGEAFSRLQESAGAKTLRVNYQGDVGLHVAKAVWAMENIVKSGASLKFPVEEDSLSDRMIYLGKCYAYGSGKYEEDAETKKEIVKINEEIYSRADSRLNKLYDLGKRWSMEYFEEIYGVIGMSIRKNGKHFDHYFFESDVQKEGTALVLSHMNIFAESQGAIVFPGEQYGLHTRVFINSKGLPTYEAKELGLNKTKFGLYNPDLSIIVTGNEIRDYFKVLLKAMELTIPHVAERTHHIAHGMLRLPSGKMSSRTGDVIAAESMINQVKEKLTEKVSDKSDLDVAEREAVTEAIAIGAIKYSILKQNPGQDIIFDFEKSLSFEGDSGPYVQYTHARLKSILRKSQIVNNKSQNEFTLLDSDIETALMRKIFDFPDVVAHAREWYAPNAIVTYIYKLASLANQFYQTTPILKDDSEERKQARLLLVEFTAQVLKTGLGLLGIETPEKI